ncbi:TetR/AcrR family transcriptional regulator [Mucilaginibacter sp. X4EP1]|jgi:AcrR family transcriptional regulator|uniref:TetR/AcrR family transcriptional regulator n=1 Tax=Mucilaginibacter sp. X4EP1 TaxID=2723092 RepID=UPI00216AAC2F|nr:TetR/AcrR family transcriptional regulator [Mucilaginibacter sp. X4EP1]MCS3811955.1 AcrR family transcriptional regulator [Mucilaginibacter sp. X4EP1]
MKKRGEVVKEKIIEAAGRLFYEQGYNLTGINQVIEEADIAKRSLYNHFDSKTDLLFSYLDKLQEDWYKEANIYLAPFKNPKKKMLALFDYRIQNQLNLNYGGCAFVKINAEAGCTDERILKKTRQNKDKLKSFIGSIIAEFKDRISPVLSNEELIQMIYLMMEGGITSTSIYKDVNELRSAKKILNKIL